MAGVYDRYFGRKSAEDIINDAKAKVIEVANSLKDELKRETNREKEQKARTQMYTKTVDLVRFSVFCT